MRIKFEDSDTEYTELSYDKIANTFLISGEGDTIECKPPLSVIKEYTPTNFSYVFLHNDREDCVENSIFQVKVKAEHRDIRIGWIFPLQALVSNEHDYSDNEHFLKYAYVAYWLLLDGIEEKDDEAKRLPETIDIRDYYDENSIMLVMDKENIAQIHDFSLEDYYIDLFRKGYSYIGHGNLISQINQIEDKALNLKKISSDIKSPSVLTELFKNSIPLKIDNEFARFLLYYQVVEILISNIFEHSFSFFMQSFQNGQYDLFEKKEELDKMANEKIRVRQLFSSYSSIKDEDLSALNVSCCELLIRCNKNTSERQADNLYAVRCLIAHELYSVLNNHLDDVLKRINDVFIDVLMDILFSFKKPAEN